MNKTKMLSWHNIKKNRGQFISFGLIIFITAFILNASVVLFLQTGKAYDRRFNELNTANINFCIPEQLDSDSFRSKISDVSGVTKIETHKAVFASATVKGFRDTDFEMSTLFYNFDDSRKMNTFNILENGEVPENAVYLPMYMSQMGGFMTGDEIVYRIGDKDFTFTVCGIIEEMQNGNYGTGLMGAYLPQKTYDSFVLENSDMIVTEYSLITDASIEKSIIKSDIGAVSDINGVNVITIKDSDTGKLSRTMVCTLIILILAAFSLIVLMVSMFLCKFRISNTIEDEITDMGVLKATGYTSDMIIASHMIPYMTVGVASSLLGVFSSYGILPVIANVLGVQSGFMFTPHFDIAAMFLSVMVITIVICIFTYASAKKIRTLKPINAIRGVTESSCTQKNSLPLDTTAGNLHVNLVLKQMVSSKRQNVLLFIITFVIMVLLSFAGTLFYNVNIKPENFLNTLSEETPQIIFEAKTGKTAELEKILKNDPQIKKELEYSTLSVNYEKGSMPAIVCRDFTAILNDICYEGENPDKADEIAIGSELAKDYNIGSRIEITTKEKSYLYTVTGYIQSINNNGVICELSQDGYAKIGSNDFTTIHAYLNEGADIQKTIERYENDYPELISSTINYDKMTQTVQKTFSGVITAAIAVIFLLTILIVLLVIYIIIKSMITRRKQELGIYKAIGYSSRQLIVQSAGSFLPVTIAASVISSLLGIIYVPMISKFIFGMIGAMKNHFEISLGFILMFAAAFTVVSFIISMLLASPIKKISAYSLIKE